jgi:hypothetical protein
MRKEDIMKQVKPKVEQLDNIPPMSNPFHHDMVRMGTQIGIGNEHETLMAMYCDAELDAREVIIIDTVSGVCVKVKLPPTTWARLQTTIEVDCYETSRRFDFNQKVNDMEKCPYCGKKHTMGYIGMKRARYHWKDMPKELHFALCGACDAVHFLKIER